MREEPTPTDQNAAVKPERSLRSWSTTSLLTVVLAVSVYGFVGYQLYNMIVLPVAVSLSAEYEPFSRWLTVRGGAYCDAKAVKSGIAKVVFETSYPNATHSFHVPVRDGKFAVDAEIGATAGRPGTLRRVTAIVETEGAGTGVGRVLGPYEVDSWILYALVMFWLVLVGTFVWWFTGEYSRVKQRYAIIYSYMLAALFLIVPLAIPIAVVVVPGLAPVLAKTPVGFLRVGTATISKDKITIDQWSLNIGGTPALHRDRQGSDTSSPEQPAAPSSEPGRAVAAPAAVSQSVPAAPDADGGAAPGRRDQLAKLPTVAVGSPSDAVPPSAAAGNGPVTDIKAATISLLERDDPETENTYDVTGGLVVPLYVVILATIGGAFRMTRSVPVIERKIRSVESRRLQRVSVSVKDWIAVPMQAALAPFEALRPGRARAADADGGGLAMHGTEIEAKVEQEVVGSGAALAPAALAGTVATQPHDSESSSTAVGASVTTTLQTAEDASDDQAKPAARGTLEDELAQAREELTHQVLFLFTSPFMGILAYYALVFVHAEFGTKTPIVAIVAFVSGIKSEDVLQKIVDLAQGQLTSREQRETT